MRSSVPLRIAVSQLTTLRWELPEELCHCVEHGFDAISLWRPKLSDTGVASARELLQQAGVRVSSLQWAGGFTGSDGRTFEESLADCHDAIETAEQLACPVLTVYAGCRGGHTLSHAHRLVRHALRELAPLADAAGVTLAIKPIPYHGATGCGFISSLEETVDLIEEVDVAGLGLAVDLWAFADDPCFSCGFGYGMEQLLRHVCLVSMADRNGPVTDEQERLPPGTGRLPLERWLSRLVEAGYQGDIEIDPVGEAVMQTGYEETLVAIGRYVAEFAYWEDLRGRRRAPLAAAGAQAGRSS
jgi:sugar phosphate isomerase/epimerase